MPDVFGTIYDNGGAVLNVRHSDFGAVGDGVADDTAAFQDAIATARAGETIYVPRPPQHYRITGTLSFAGKENVAMVGSDGLVGNPIWFTGTGDAAVSLVGARGITLRNLDFYAANPPGPDCVVLLGRSDEGSWGTHLFDRVSAGGYAQVAVVYNVASEENAFRNCYFHLNGGGARYVVALSQGDALGVGAALTASTCLSNWMQHCRLLRIAPATPAGGDALIYIQARGSTGDFAFRDGFMATTAGAAVHIEVPNETQYPFGFLFDGLRCENLGTQAYGVRITGQAGATIDGVELRAMNFPNLAAGGFGVHAADEVRLRGARFTGNMALTPTGAAGSYVGQGIDLVIEEPYTAFHVEDLEASSFLVGGKRTFRRTIAWTWGGAAIRGASEFADIPFPGAALGDRVAVTPASAVTSNSVEYFGRVLFPDQLRIVMVNHGCTGYAGTDTLNLEVTKW